MTSNAEELASQTVAPGGPVVAGRVTLFVTLWVVWAALLTVAMLLGGFAGGHGSSVATAARMSSSVTLIVVGWTAYAVWQRSAAGTFALLIAVGMTLGTIGDLFNAGLLTFVPLPNPVLGGIAAFGLGHIAYITGCVNLARRAGLTNRGTMFGAIVVWQLIGLVGWYVIVMQGSEARDLVWPALPYSLLLAGTAGVAGGLALQDRRLAWLALGAALFLVSDLVLAFGLFRGSFAHQTECVWLTYAPGQMLIVFSTICAALVLADKR